MTLDTEKQLTNFSEMVKHERELVEKWKKEGVLENLFLRQDKNGAVLIFKNLEVAEVKDLISSLPLFPYMKTVEYLGLIKQF